MPAFRAAASRATRNERLLGDRDVLERIASTRPVLALDHRGSLLWMSSLAEKVLGGSLPPALTLRAAGRELSPTLDLELEDGSSALACFSLARRDSGEPFVVVELTGEAVRRGRLTALASRHGLTPAEMRVLGTLAEGLSNAAIARRLVVSEGTIRLELTAIFRKLGVANRLQAALLVSQS